MSDDPKTIDSNVTILQGYDREMLTNMALAVSDYIACCPESNVADDSTQYAAMAINLLLELSKRKED